MPSQIHPRSGPFPIYQATSPPAIDVGIFTIAKSGVDLKTAATTTIFTVPAGRTFLPTGCYAMVTAVTSGGLGTLTWKMIEGTGSRIMMTNSASISETPVANQTIYNINTTSSGDAYSTCPAGDTVRVTISASNAGSTAVTGTVYVSGFYTT